MDLFLVFLMSFDAFFACMSCGMRKIRIPQRAAAVIAGIGTACLALSFFLSRALAAVLSPALFHYISCGALALIALLCLFEDGVRRLSARLASRCSPLRFRLCGLVLEICADTEKADLDRSGVLSAAEACVLALPLSLDSLLTGLSVAATARTAPLLLGVSFVCGLGAARGGAALGRRLGRAAGNHAGLLSGLALLAVTAYKLTAG